MLSTKEPAGSGTGGQKFNGNGGAELEFSLAPSDAFHRITDKLREHGSKVVESRQGQAQAQCPAHDDGNPSLSITRIDGQVLVYCHTGCDTADVLAALGIASRDLFDDPNPAKLKGIPAHATYRYPDGRIVARSADKRFRQDGNTKGGALFRDVAEAVQAGSTVYLAEGEKDVLAIESAGGVATSAAQGAQNIDKADLTPLHGADIVAIVDRDQQGQKWAGTVWDKLDGKAATLRFAEAVKGKDAADHIAAGHTLAELADCEVTGTVPPRRARVTWASDIAIKPVVWAWQTDEQGRLPAGALTIAAGREGTGKSSFGVWLAAQITAGTLPGSFHGIPHNVFYVAAEDSWEHTLVPRLKAAGADLSRVGRFDVISDTDDEMMLSLPSDNELLEHEIGNRDVALVILDPILSVIHASIDSYKSRDVRLALDPLSKMADRTGALLLGIAHFNKASGTDPASLLSDSHAFRDVPRAMLAFAKDNTSGERVMSQGKNSLGRDDLPSLSYTLDTATLATDHGVAETSVFSFGGESERSVSDLLRDARGDDDERSERDEAAEWLKTYLATEGGSAPAAEILKDGRAAGFSESTLKRAKRKAGIDSQRDGFGKGSKVTWTHRDHIGANRGQGSGGEPYGPYVNSMEGGQSSETPIGAIGASPETPAPMAPTGAPMGNGPPQQDGPPQQEEPPRQADCPCCGRLLVEPSPACSAAHLHGDGWPT